MSKENTKNILAKFLANTYATYLKTQNYHWNVTGPNFYNLHLMLETQYRSLAESVDEIAERISTLGFKSPGSFTEFQKLSIISDPISDFSANEMIEDLVKSYNLLNEIAKNVINSARESLDIGTEDLAIKKISENEKFVWMLKNSANSTN